VSPGTDGRRARAREFAAPACPCGGRQPFGRFDSRPTARDGGGFCCGVRLGSSGRSSGV